MKTITKKLPDVITTSSGDVIARLSGSIMGKPVYVIIAKSAMSDKSGFKPKGMCTGWTVTAGYACLFGCVYCYVETMLTRQEKMNLIKQQAGLAHEDITIRLADPLGLIKLKLIDSKGKPRKHCREFNVVYCSPFVDAAPTNEFAEETTQIMKFILENTVWDIRILSKSNKLPSIAKALGDEYKSRVIYGVSAGTLDDKLTSCFERKTASVSSRIQSLHWLQDNGYRTFGMICPSLPQVDYGKFSQEICDAIRIDKCEHVWGEILNERGGSIENTCKALRDAGFSDEAERLWKYRKGYRWERYARQTFKAHTRNIPPEKLRFLQYVNSHNLPWWQTQEINGAVPLGKAAHG